ncbi:ABC transporter permease [Nocardioides bizhenqiangii]|uniref:ABC transporter permease subunit n=1 Tax=Nocardioides bizhenqiangii TaxID=3095076 RepID=A0ABZ0ZUT7_9ACTN|nr:ABC transporter permease subunit [Nocardioides sp. HM61]WQQ27584.1 ABC transporter permease subunit [Nocardioides sp. HM61]
MTWLVWRQHRGELLGAGVILVGLGILLVLHGIPMHEAYDRDGVAACHAKMVLSEDTGSCSDVLADFDSRYGFLPGQFAAYLPFLPMLAGMLIGAPLLAREYEQGTWQLAWTQGVTRRRWLAAKLALVLGGVLAVSVVFAAGVTWWFAPTAPHQFTTAKFNHAVLVFPAYVIVAVAIGILAGLVVRRTLVAAAITVAGYLLVRLPVEFLLRPRYREPLTTDDPAVEMKGLPIHDVVVEGPVDGPTAPTSLVRFHPADRFWEFQLIESAILAGVTIVLLAVTWRLVVGSRAPVSHPAPQRTPARR